MARESKRRTGSRPGRKESTRSRRAHPGPESTPLETEVNPMPVPAQSDHNLLTPIDMVQRGTHGPYRGNAEFKRPPTSVKKRKRPGR